MVDRVRDDGTGWIDPGRLFAIVLEAVEQQPIGVQRPLRDAMHAGEVEVWGDPKKSWVHVVVCGHAVAKVAPSRISKAGTAAN